MFHVSLVDIYEIKNFRDRSSELPSLLSWDNKSFIIIIGIKVFSP